MADEEGRCTVVIAGCKAHVCLIQIALDRLEEKFEVWVVTDACNSRSERNRDAAFDRLAGAGAEPVTTEMVAFEWLRTAEHPVVREVGLGEAGLTAENLRETLHNFPAICEQGVSRATQHRAHEAKPP